MPIPIIYSSDFNYDLPQEKIAQHPLSLRDASKLLVVKKDVLIESNYRQIANYIEDHTLMVFNNSKVIPARLIYFKSSGAIIELFCLEPIQLTPQEALQNYTKSSWTCMIGGLKKWKTNEPLIWNLTDHHQLEAHFIGANENGFEIQFSWNNDEMSFGEILNELGQMPIPPYLMRKADVSDTLRYQTTYATQAGSVAAPTAGLHFTDSIFNDLSNKKISCLYATLHVGAGTFKPVQAEQANEHEMHAEWIEISKEFIQKLMEQKNICAVGTTSLRTIESIYWYAILAKKNDGLFNESFTLPQFVAFENYEVEPKNELLNWLCEQLSLQNRAQLRFRNTNNDIAYL